MTEENKAKTIDGELPRHCAYTIPGVVLALGAEHWSLLKDTYELLSTDMQVFKQKKNHLIVAIIKRCIFEYFYGQLSQIQHLVI